MDADEKKTAEEKSETALKEEEIQAFWERERIFKKTEDKEAPRGEFVFYDGPPFATGLPHYGHLLASTIKDAIPRYRTMRGFRVRRRWGWDCHGLPLENLIEKELGLQTKRDIEKLGVGVFNEAARAAVLRYADEWKKQIPRIGRWADMENDYKTMDVSYTESVWWAFNRLWGDGLIYEGFKSMHLCPRCGTTLSNFEVNQGYADITDFAVTVKLPLLEDRSVSLLVWTTTPWTLPGNMAAAVNADAQYAKVKVTEADGREACYILAEARLDEVLKDRAYTLVETFSGATLVGKSYVPPFDYFEDKELKGKEHAWKIYHAPYVSLEDGTGAVHLAPAFGAEDLELAQAQHIPIVHHVTTEGVFTEDVRDFVGMPVKPKGDHQVADIEIIKNLAHRDLLFKKEKITHSYPLCWRCDTPLLNYAASSWFVRVTSLRDQLVRANREIRWVPHAIGAYRFGNWLENAHDWAISRSRYWGAPLPVWRNQATGALTVIGSLDELKDKTKRSGNRYFIMRHGQAQLSDSQVLNAKADAHNALTEEGKRQVEEAAASLKHQSITYIVTSPLPRTFQTALMVAKELGISEDHVLVDPRLTEITFGSFERKTVPEYHAFYKNPQERLTVAPDGGENWNSVKRRTGGLLYELEREHRNAGVLLVSHNGPLQMLQAAARGLNEAQTGAMLLDRSCDMQTGEVRELPFIPLPHNEDFTLDLHRPYIDEAVLVDPDGTALTRIGDVFDCWFESGSMPYGQNHYPFEHTDVFEPQPGLFSKARGYPADFISEGLDQTRGWFYSMLVLGMALFGRAPYKNVIVSGLVLSEDGQKMSKRLKNYPDPMEVVNRYGADALRYYLLSSSIMRGEDLNFSEKGVAEVGRKVITRLRNVHSFLALYGEVNEEQVSASPNVLDQWIMARLQQVALEMTEAIERYELDAATRPIGAFIDDLSTWYVRRSRERMKGDDEADRSAAHHTLRTVLRELSKLLAPITPFYAEELYQALRRPEDPESVHLETWPDTVALSKAQQELLSAMQETRRLVSLALEARQSAGIRVRQPLSELRIRPEGQLSEPFRALIRDEVNVKAVSEDATLPGSVFLNTQVTEDLRREGIARELIRRIQELRKERGCAPAQLVGLRIRANTAGAAVLDAYQEHIMKAAYLSSLNRQLEGEGVPLAVDGFEFTLALEV